MCTPSLARYERLGMNLTFINAGGANAGASIRLQGRLDRDVEPSPRILTGCVPLLRHMICVVADLGNGDRTVYDVLMESLREPS
jgi:hypothetical protein